MSQRIDKQQGAMATVAIAPETKRAGAFNGQELSRSAHSPARERIYLSVLALTMVFLASVYPLLVNSMYEGSSDLHATIEVVGALFGLVSGLALIVCFYILGNRFHLFIGLAFFVNGAEDFIHGLIAFRNIFGLPASSIAQFIPGTYVTGRLLMGVILLLAPAISTRFGGSANPQRETKWVSATVLVITVVLTALAFQTPLPNLIYPENLISRPVDFLSAVVLAVALAAFLREYHRGRDVLTWWISLSIGVNIVGQVLMSFSKSLYDPFFDIAHVYKVLGYMTPLLGFSLHQITIIAERKWVEEALRESVELLRIVVDATPALIMVKDWDGKFVLANEETARLYGHTPEEMVGKSLPELVDMSPSEKILFNEYLEGDREVIDSKQPHFIPEEQLTFPGGTT
ncbi:MAG: MASE3 domain-containing protein, partial [Anaerolineae bacterium]